MFLQINFLFLNACDFDRRYPAHLVFASQHLINNDHGVSAERGMKFDSKN